MLGQRTSTISGEETREIGRTLAEIRQSQGLHQRLLADRAGLAINTVQRLETLGKGWMASLEAYCAAAHIEIDGLPLKGKPLGMRLHEARGSRLTREIATAAGLDSRTVAALEDGRGQIASLLAVVHELRRSLILSPARSLRVSRPVYGRDQRFTPVDWVERILPILGNIGLDPCGHPDSPTSQLAARMITEAEDGLSQPWTCGAGSFVWVNPPFSRTRPFGLHALREWRAGRAPVIAMLIRMAWDTCLYQDELALCADNFALQDRPAFLGPSGEVMGKNRRSPMSLSLHVLGASVPRRLQSPQPTAASITHPRAPKGSRHDPR